MYFCVFLCNVCFVLFSVLIVCICVMNYCLQVATQLQLNISYHIIVFNHIGSCQRRGDVSCLQKWSAVPEIRGIRFLRNVGSPSYLHDITPSKHNLDMFLLRCKNEKKNIRVKNRQSKHNSFCFDCQIFNPNYWMSNYAFFFQGRLSLMWTNMRFLFFSISGFKLSGKIIHFISYSYIPSLSLSYIYVFLSFFSYNFSSHL